MVDWSNNAQRREALGYIITAIVLCLAVLSNQWRQAAENDRFYEEMREHHKVAEDVYLEVIVYLKNNQEHIEEHVCHE